MPAILPLFVAAGSGVAMIADLCRLSVLRLSPLRIANFLAQSALAARYDCAEAPWSSARCPFRPMTAISIATPPIFSR